MSSDGTVTRNDNIAFERATWFVQRCSWVIMAGVLLAALLGAFGGGPLSDRRWDSPDGRLTVEYERFLRNRAPAALKVVVRQPGDFALSLSRSGLERLDVRGVTPTPARVVAAEGRVIFSFVSEQSSDEPVAVKFELEARGTGSVRTLVRLEGTADAAVLEQFIYP